MRPIEGNVAVLRPDDDRDRNRCLAEEIPQPVRIHVERADDTARKRRRAKRAAVPRTEAPQECGEVLLHHLLANAEFEADTSELRSELLGRFDEDPAVGDVSALCDDPL